MITLHLEIQDNQAELFRRTIAYLTANTFIIAQKEKGLFNYVKNPANQTYINTFFEIMNCKLYVDEELGVAMLQPIDKDAEETSFKTERFSSPHSAVLLVLAKIYMDQFERGKEVICTTVGELIDHLHAYKVIQPPNEKNWIINALTKFRRLSLVDFNTGKDKRLSEDTVIIIYDSIRLQICSSGRFETFKANLKDYGYDFSGGELNDDASEEEEITMDQEDD